VSVPVAVLVVITSIAVIPFVVTAAVVFAFMASVVIVVISVLAVVMSIVVSNFFAVFMTTELLFPSVVAAPVGALAADGEPTVVTEARIIGAIDVSAEAYRAVEPGACSEEDSACKPRWSVVAKWSASIRRVVEVAIWTKGLGTYIDGDLYLGLESGRGKAEKRDEGRREKAE
jgi:hypothetical protein